MFVKYCRIRYQALWHYSTNSKHWCATSNTVYLQDLATPLSPQFIKVFFFFLKKKLFESNLLFFENKTNGFFFYRQLLIQLNQQSPKHIPFKS